MVFTEQVAVTGDDEPKKEPVVLLPALADF